MLAPKDQITSKEDCCSGWLEDAGTRATSRTLIVKDEAAYNALKTNNLLPSNYWQAGNCAVKAADETDIK